MLNEQSSIHAIAEEEGFFIKNISPLAGGDINAVFLLDTSEGKKVAKVNEANRFPGMFKAEKEGLEALKGSNTVDVPEVLGLGTTGNITYILLEYKARAPQKPDFWDRFAQDLASLHQNTNGQFGFHTSNYIGSLPQHNGKHESAAEFYIEERLEPQLKMALENGFTFEKLERSLKNISEAIPKQAPALLHGDLWNGNYITNEQGLPCFIDPAVCFGPREMDLAMMKLFGGFPEEVYLKYDEIFPLEKGFYERVPFWQLYYLLVHLNIFGSSYLPQVRSILKSFS
ncbi:fructosamine kinase family protein [Salinimicrobium gaetbulicola]|uniref:Fructosamine kinase family protein n=1 Tax=Salinimicrobium gaetbulicola TaxID=999702 RepID=A0ABW3IEY9_9FLAO